MAAGAAQKAQAQRGSVTSHLGREKKVLSHAGPAGALAAPAATLAAFAPTRPRPPKPPPPPNDRSGAGGGGLGGRGDGGARGTTGCPPTVTLLASTAAWGLSLATQAAVRGQVARSRAKARALASWERRQRVTNLTTRRLLAAAAPALPGGGCSTMEGTRTWGVPAEEGGGVAAAAPAVRSADSTRTPSRAPSRTENSDKQRTHN